MTATALWASLEATPDGEARMKLKVVLYESAEGFTVMCPGLPGCLSEADTREEALENIRIAVREYLEVGWILFKREMQQDIEEYPELRVTYGDIEVDTTGVEDAEAEEVEIAV